MNPPDRSHTFSTGAAQRRARTAVKAHPIAAAVATLTLALALLTALRESRHTSRPQIGVISAHARRPQGAVVTVLANPGLRSGQATQPRSAVTITRSRRRAAPTYANGTGRMLWPSAALSAARRFLRTYLPFTYGQLPARTIRGAVPALRTRIAASPPEVPATIRRLHPRVTALTIIPARIIDSGAGWAAIATVTDRLETYHVTVTLGQQHGRWLVTSILAPSD
jgi:hypothetical protein